MKPSLVPSIIEPYSGKRRKRRRLDGLCTGHSQPPLVFDTARCGIEGIVCYGMIDGLPVLPHPHSTVFEPYGVVPVNLHSDCTLRRGKDGGIAGVINNEIFGMLETLAHEGIECQLSATWSDSGVGQKKDACLLDTIFYGPKCSADSFGIFMEQYGYCLQDPYDCDRNVPYVNPHRLSSMFDDPPMTYAIQKPRMNLIELFTKAARDALANFETSEVLEQATTPSALVTPLQLHQKQALAFFRRRELGLGASNVHCGIWQARYDGSDGDMFLNIVTDQMSPSRPPVWRGGILADEMGLGKTLSMIALIASDKENPPEQKEQPFFPRNDITAQSTLVIVPNNVLSAWESQLKLHVKAGDLSWTKHQGKNRISSRPGAKLPDIILTTYQTVEAEYRRAKSKPGALCAVHWRRIILDEAHIIRNWKTSTAIGIASLSAVSRWAVSGTPIQNGLQDLLGLFKFLQFQPYDAIKDFNRDITALSNNRTLEESIEKLTRLLSCVMIRRTKATATISLPHRSEQVVRLRFTPQEKAHYETIERPAARLLESEYDEVQTSGPVWLSALQQIHSLRMVCNLGVSNAPSRPNFGLSKLINEDSASRNLGARLLMGDASCQQCLVVFDLHQDTSRPDTEVGQTAWYSDCYRLFCASCARLFDFETPKPCECEDFDSSCALRPIPLRQLTPVSTPVAESPSPAQDRESNTYLSTKITALSSDIMQHLDEKSVVFSFWTTSLDMVEHALKQVCIDYVRIDGKVPSGTRKRALERYRNDPNVKVMLITTSCGAVGIDLTAATRAYMLEPQWNPTVEEQAMARIHRIGQTHPVTTIKYIMEESIEEHIVDVVQDRKKLLTSMLLPATKRGDKD